MKNTATILLVIISITLFSCGPRVEGNGNVTKKEHKIGNVTNIDVSGQFVVILRQGKTPNLTIEADDNLHEYIKVKVLDNTVKISTDAYITQAEELNIYVTMKDYNVIDLSGAIELKSDSKIKTDKLIIDASGATEIDLDINVKKLILDMSGASEIILSGKAENMAVDASGATEIEAYKLKTENMNIDISGAGSADVYVTKTLEVEISGAGEIRYKGSPIIEKDISGAGSIKAAK